MSHTRPPGCAKRRAPGSPSAASPQGPGLSAGSASAQLDGRTREYGRRAPGHRRPSALPSHGAFGFPLGGWASPTLPSASPLSAPRTAAWLELHGGLAWGQMSVSGCHSASAGRQEATTPWALESDGPGLDPQLAPDLGKAVSSWWPSVPARKADTTGTVAFWCCEERGVWRRPAR